MSKTSSDPDILQTLDAQHYLVSQVGVQGGIKVVFCIHCIHLATAGDISS